MFKKYSSLFFSLLLVVMTSHAFATGAIEDTAITAGVKAKLAADKMVSASEIKVSTNQGVVSLQGSVKSEAEANTAVELASSIPGVTDVETSQLFVQGSSQPLADSLITAKIKGIYVREKIMGDAPVAVGIHVETTNGAVFLSGNVDNKAQAENAEKLAKGVKGVKEVKSSLSIKE